MNRCRTMSGSQPNLSFQPPWPEPQPKRSNSLSELGTGRGFTDPILLEGVGSGTYSVVYKCKLENNGPILAAKVMKMNPSEGAPGTAIREASILRLLKHDNIVTLHEVIYKPGQLTLILEYIEDNLSTYMMKCDLPRDSDTVQRFSIHLFQGLTYIHRMKIIHRDLKPDNLLITNSGVLKITDFGKFSWSQGDFKRMARQKFAPMCDLGKRVVTLWYKAPEILLEGCKYDFGIDVWSAGCIVYEMMNGEVLFEGSNPLTQICRIFQVLGMPPLSYWPDLRCNQTFQKIQEILEKCYPTVGPTLEIYDIKTHLKNSFTNLSNRHWREHADAFDLLEACLQPYEPKRITAKEALDMDFLVKRVIPSQNFQAHGLVSWKRCSQTSTLSNSKAIFSITEVNNDPSARRGLDYVPQHSKSSLRFIGEIACGPIANLEHGQAVFIHRELLLFPLVHQCR
ncbi:unnamed protein product [Hydatigera taeniaeformis]|uniref:cyclin-dependent kinase n=1 Tax=Hydatigena taeniaeformis TaxID=6205 RepID=A0A0R3WLB8_HYDTA|nr:unnamed protein product [Hydatigera taeniaeformis]